MTCLGRTILGTLVATLCLVGGVMASEHVVTPKPRQVMRNDKIDYNDEETVKADVIEITEHLRIVSKTFVPPTRWLFMPFPSGTFVDIWANPEGLEYERIIDTAVAIRVAGVFELSATNAGQFPLRCEGNLQPPSGGHGGQGGPSELPHWSAKMDAAGMDLDIDSDNDDGMNDPERSPEEDEIEENLPGKIIQLNDGDFDEDGVPDYADGFDLFPGDPENKDDQIERNPTTHEAAKFPHLILEAPEGSNPEKAEVTFTYSASNPDNPGMRSGNETDGYTYTLPTDGKLRIWKKDAGERRNKAEIDASGDYVAPGKKYKLKYLGEPIRPGVYRLFVEGVGIMTTPEEHQIKAALGDAESGGGVDTVTATVIQMQFVVPGEDYYGNSGSETGNRNYGSTPVPTEFVGVSDPKPTVTLDTPSVPSISGAGGTVTITLSGVVHDPIADNVPQGGGADIEKVTASVEGETAGNSPDVRRESDGDAAFWRQHPYKGMFSGLSVPLTVAEGTQTIRVTTSKNAAGNEGSADVAVTFTKQEIPGTTAPPDGEEETTVALNVRFPVPPQPGVIDTAEYWCGASDDPNRATLAERPGSVIAYDGQWASPSLAVAIDVDAEGNVYAPVRGEMRKYSPTGAPIKSYPIPLPAGLREIRYVKSMAVAPDGTLYVLVSGYAGANPNLFLFETRLLRLAASGFLLQSWGGRPDYGGDAAFFDGEGVAVDEAGNAYVTGYFGNNEQGVRKINANGTLGIRWGTDGTGPGQFKRPAGIAAGGGFVYVSDNDPDITERLVQQFDAATGAFIRSWGTKGTGNGQMNGPGAMTCADGIVYVSDEGNFRVQAFLADGTFLTTWGSYGRGNGQFYDVFGLSAKNEFVYVADGTNERIQRFRRGGAVDLTFHGTYAEAPTVLSITPETFSLTANVDTFTATVTYTLADGSTMTLGPLTFTETGATTNQFRATMQAETGGGGEGGGGGGAVTWASKATLGEKSDAGSYTPTTIRVKGLSGISNFVLDIKGTKIPFESEPRDDDWYYPESGSVDFAVIVPDPNNPDNVKVIYYDKDGKTVKKEAQERGLKFEGTLKDKAHLEQEIAKAKVSLLEININADYDRNGTPKDSASESSPVDYQQTKGAVILANADFDNGGNSRDCDNETVDGNDDLQDIGKITLNKLGNLDAAFLKKLRVEVELSNPKNDTYNKAVAERGRLFSDYTANAKGGVKIIFKDSPNTNNGERDISDLKGTGEVSLGIEGIDFGAEVLVKATLKYPGQSPETLATDEVRVLVAPLILLPNSQELQSLARKDNGTQHDFFVGFFTPGTYPNYTSSVNNALTNSGINNLGYSADVYLQDSFEIGYSRVSNSQYIRIIASFGEAGTLESSYVANGVGMCTLPQRKNTNGTVNAGDMGGEC